MLRLCSSLRHSSATSSALYQARSLSTVTASPFRKPKYSGLQREVLSLYRSYLRAARHKKTPESRRNFEDRIRSEFRKSTRAPSDGGVDRRDFATVEFLIRKGKRQLELYGRPDVTLY